MAQHDFNIANQTPASFRPDLNNALEALVTLSSGSSEPAATYEYMLWYDAANDVLKIRNDTDTDWITLFVFDQANDSVTVEQSSVEDYLLGVGQSWQDLSGSRAFGTSYQNTTGKPISVSVEGNASSAFEVSTDNINWLTIGGIGPSTYTIPNNLYYRQTGTGSPTLWAELR
jgi:hypothetical protein